MPDAQTQAARNVEKRVSEALLSPHPSSWVWLDGTAALVYLEVTQTRLRRPQPIGV